MNNGKHKSYANTAENRFVLILTNIRLEFEEENI